MELLSIVAQPGTMIECMSKWFDYKVLKFMQLVPVVIKDSKTLQDTLIALHCTVKEQITNNIIAHSKTKVVLRQLVNQCIETLRKMTAHMGTTNNQMACQRGAKNLTTENSVATGNISKYLRLQVCLLSNIATAV